MIPIDQISLFGVTIIYNSYCSKEAYLYVNPYTIVLIVSEVIFVAPK